MGFPPVLGLMDPFLNEMHTVYFTNSNYVKNECQISLSFCRPWSGQPHEPYGSEANGAFIPMSPEPTHLCREDYLEKEEEEKY